jgi:2-oxoglutarate ferredoxin oxidoreductase subunit delta
MNRKKKEERIRINSEQCKGCMLCVEVCPLKLLEKADGVNSKGLSYVRVKDPEKCISCGLCAVMCPDCVIEISGPEEKEEEGKEKSG